MAGMRDIAKLSGVSLSTVSVVLGDGSKYVSEETARKVKDAAESLGYRLPQRKRFTQKTIAVIMPVATSSFFSNVLNGIEETISQDKNLLLYYNSNYNFEKEKTCIRTLKKQSLAGIILNSICPISLETEYYAWLKADFIDSGIPIVVLERKIDRDGFYSIFVDNVQIAYVATKYLIDCGHRRIAHIKGNEKMLHTAERFDGYCKALSEAKIEHDAELVQCGDFTPFSGYVAAKRLMEIQPYFTAVFSANDQMAIGAIKAARMAGKSVPNDIAVVGIDNLSVSSLIDPALTTINVPTYQMGRLAAQIVLKASEKIACERLNPLETNLVIRRSSDISATNEWELAGW